MLCGPYAMEEDKIGRKCGTCGEREMPVVFWWGKLKRKDHLKRPKCRWQDNIKVYIKEMKLESVDWINLAQGTSRLRAVFVTVVKLSSAMNVEDFSDWLGNW